MILSPHPKSPVHDLYHSTLLHIMRTGVGALPAFLLTLLSNILLWLIFLKEQILLVILICSVCLACVCSFIFSFGLREGLVGGRFFKSTDRWLSWWCRLQVYFYVKCGHEMFLWSCSDEFQWWQSRTSGIIYKKNNESTYRRFLGVSCLFIPLNLHANV